MRRRDSKEIAGAIRNRIWEDLRGRAGFDGVHINEETEDEILGTWFKIVREELEKS